MVEIELWFSCGGIEIDLPVLRGDSNLFDYSVGAEINLLFLYVVEIDTVSACDIEMHFVSVLE